MLAVGPEAKVEDAREEELTLTILVPCLNEAETIATVVGKACAFLQDEAVAGEVVVADNGSTDGSQEIARSLGARVVDIPVRGYGAALGGGIAAARGRYVIMGDADDSYDLRRLGGFLAALEGGADLVMGNRFMGGIAQGAMPPLHRYLGNPVLTWIGRLLFPSPVGDFHCGLRGFRRDRILGLGLQTTGMEFASEMVVRASLARLTIVEVPTTLAKDGRSRPPHLRTWRDGWRHLRFLLLHSPRWLFAYPGAALVLGGLALMAVLLLAGPLHFGRRFMLSSHTLLAAGMAIMLGIQLLTFGAIARRHAHRTGVLPDPGGRAGRLEALTLERLLTGSAALVATSLAALAWYFAGSATTDFGVAHPGTSLRVLIVASCALATGVQLAFSAFLLGVLDLSGAARREA